MSAVSIFFRPMTLSTRIVVVVVTIVVITVWGLAIRVSAQLRANIEDLISAQLSAQAGYVAADMDQRIRLRVDGLNRLAASITPAILADPKKLQKAIEDPDAFIPLFPTGVFVVNKNGIVIADHPKTAGRLGGSVDPRGSFYQAMTSGKTAIGSVLRGGIAQHRAVAPIAVPLRDQNGETAGVLFSALLLSDPRMFGQLEHTRIGQTGYFIVVSPKDRLIVSAPDQSRILQRLPPKGALPQLDRRLEEGYEGVGITQTAIGVQQLSTGRKLTTTGWMLLGGVPTEEIFAPIVDLRRQVYLAALLISLIAAVILRSVLARQLAPLKKAGAAMRRMTEGNEPLAPIPVTRVDEVGELIASFNQLAEERLRLDETLRGEIAERKQAEEALATALKRLQALSEHLTKAQEEERRRIAVEMHEQWGQDFAILAMHLKALEAQCSGSEAKARLKDARTIAALALEQVRNMSLELRPPQLDDFGLYMALRAHCRDQADAAGLVLHFDAPESGERPEQDVELACFRVVQEAFGNVVQHANATDVWVSLHCSGDELQLELRDNGVGFDVAGVRDLPGGRGLGLMAMEERIRQFGGRLEINTSPGKGTKIHAVFPCHCQTPLPPAEI